MPAVNPRLTITISEPLSLALKRLSELTGSSQSRLISESLCEALPVYTRMIQVLEAAEKAKHAVRVASADRLELAQSKVEKQLGLALEGFDDMTGSLLAELEQVQRRARRRPVDESEARARDGTGSAGKGAPLRGERAPARTAPTPLSNRGVRSDPKPSKKRTATTSYTSTGRVVEKTRAKPQKGGR